MAEPDARPGVQTVLVLAGPSMEAQFKELLDGIDPSAREARMSLEELSLQLGRRLPDGAQTMTYWQRGELGRILRRACLDVRVELGHVIFTRPAL